MADTEVMPASADATELNNVTSEGTAKAVKEFETGEEETKTGVSTATRRRNKANRAKHSKRFLELEKSTSKTVVDLQPLAAFELMKTLATAKFNETIEVAINLGVDPRHGDQMVRGTTNMPHGTGKSRVVWVFARGEKANDATAAGADLVGAEDLLEKIQKEGGATCDILVATPDMMPLVGRLGQILKQKMPNPKAGTVSPNIGQVVKDIKQATRAEYRVDKNGIIHAAVGKANFTAEQLHENFAALVSALVKAKPAASKGKYLRKVTLTSTMGPSVTLDVLEVQKIADRG